MMLTMVATMGEQNSRISNRRNNQQSPGMRKTLAVLNYPRLRETAPIAHNVQNATRS